MAHPRTERAPTARDAETALGRLRESLVGLQPKRAERSWQLALHGLADEAEDVIVVLWRLERHERVWRESMGTQSAEEPTSSDPNEATKLQMARGRSDLRSFILLLDVLLDNAVRALRSLGAPNRPTGSLRTLVDHLEGGGDAWSRPLRPLAGALGGLQHSLAYFRDKFVAHRNLQPVTASYLPDGRVQLGLVAGTKSPEELARGGNEAARLLSDFVTNVPETSLDPVHDVRLDIAFSVMSVAPPARRRELDGLLREFGTTSPDPYATAVRASAVITQLLIAAADDLGAPCG